MPSKHGRLRGRRIEVRQDSSRYGVAVAAVVVADDLPAREFGVPLVGVVDVLVMPEVRRALGRPLMLAIRGRRRPGELERQKHRHEEENEASHAGQAV